jgi:hypothetical protein
MFVILAILALLLVRLRVQPVAHLTLNAVMAILALMMFAAAEVV